MVAYQAHNLKMKVRFLPARPNNTNYKEGIFNMYISVEDIIRSIVNFYNNIKYPHDTKISEDTVIGLLSSPTFGDFIHHNISLSELLQVANKREERKL